MRALLYIIILLCIIFEAHSQEVLINAGVDVKDADKKTVIELWTNYLQSKPDSLYDNPYWNNHEKRYYKSFDLLNSEGFLSLHRWNKNNIILFVKRFGDYHLIRSLFHYEGTDTGKTNISAIVNVIARRENGQFRLFNYLPLHTNDWLTATVGRIKYIYHPMHGFDPDKAALANSFLASISSAFNLGGDTITYYIAPNCDELHKMKGFDYILTMGSLDNCGSYDRINRIVYATTASGENHQHELTHIINEHFPNAHELILAGISAYWGGDNAHLAKPLIYHIKRVNEYLEKHPEIDLTGITNFYQLDSKTNPQYVIGAIICHVALQKGGITKLKELLASGGKDEDLLTFLSTDLGIPEKDINPYLRKTINALAKADSFNALPPTFDMK